MTGTDRTSLTIVVAVALASTAAFVYFNRTPGPEAAWSVVETVCVDCHNDADLAGELSLAGLTPESIAEHRETFEAVVHKLRGRLMPPPGTPALARADVDTLVAGIEAVLDDNPPPAVGHVRAQRLTRTEYTGAIEGLLGVELDPVEFLPTEIEVEGFANIASALSVSPAFVEQAVGLVRTAAHLGVGEPVPKLAAAYIPPPGRTSSPTSTASRSARAAARASRTCSLRTASTGSRSRVSTAASIRRCCRASTRSSCSSTARSAGA